MEKTCEFCTAWRPIVYCKSDSARLCLSCDVKVHSANRLSGRHPRSILCDMCRHNPAHVRCLDHRMLVCWNCDRTLHGFSSHHQKRTLNSFMGCPSAQDFASLWALHVFYVLFVLQRFSGSQQQLQKNKFILQQIL